jgi:NADH-quinone oxidoreductase subunit N
MALVFAVTGVMDLGGLLSFSHLVGVDLLIFRLGLALIFAGVGFKLAVVPFHLWTPDVYQGAPAPVTAFIATVSKGAVLVLLLRYLNRIDPHSDTILFWLISGVAYASMIVGNVLALLQRNVKRLLAYSSIAQLGYLLVPVAAGAGSSSRVAVAFYLSVYSVGLAAAFGVVSILSTKERDAESIEDYRGLARTRRGLASVFGLSLLSLAGLPITAGFIGKFFLVRSGAGADLWGLLIVLALTSAMSLFYYLRVVMIMLAPVAADREALPPEPGERLSRSLLAICTLGVLGVVLVVLGVYPSPLLHLIDHVALLGG